jgi:hypothetical protein
MKKLLCRHATCGSIGQLLLHMMLLRFLFADSILCRRGTLHTFGETCKVLSFTNMMYWGDFETALS